MTSKSAQLWFQKEPFRILKGFLSHDERATLGNSTCYSGVITPILEPPFFYFAILFCQNFLLLELHVYAFFRVLGN